VANLNSTDVLFLSHGGGPLPLLGDQGHQEMVACLTSIAADLKRPSAIIVVSAHWEAATPTITSGANPSLIYDYYGFPAESYEIKYPCPGAPQLAAALHKLLSNAGFAAVLDDRRGFDHGLFVPLKIMYPDADIPCVQLSLINSLDPETHLAIGTALQEINHDNLLIIGSGFSFHNMRAFFAPDTDESKMMNTAFETWLLDTCSNRAISEKDRTQRLVRWTDAPYARYCHPREEHLLPLHVCYGFAQTQCTRRFEVHILRKKASMYLWSQR